MTKYLAVCLPVKLLKTVDEKKEIHNFTSRADLVKNAIRRELERLNKIEQRRKQ